MKLFIVGGFLGSGKTTAIRQTSRYFEQKGKSISIITNDQGEQLVDTGYLKEEEITVEEVTGGCFCCNYHELYEKISLLQHDKRPDIIFAESVGSCTDLVATVINPILHFNKGQFDVTLSVFADVNVLCTYLRDKNEFNSDVNYIYEKQLEEADIIVVNKIDLLGEKQLQSAKALIENRYGQKHILYQSSLTTEGIQKWTSVLMDMAPSHLRQPLDLNYDRYGSGEAALAWLDKAISINTPEKQAVDAGITLINRIYARIVEKGFPVGHLKFLLDDGHQKIKISFTAVKQNEPGREFEYYETDKVAILINARVQTKAALLESVVEDAIDELRFLTGCRIEVLSSDSFHPGYPKPSYRMQLLNS